MLLSTKAVAALVDSTIVTYGMGDRQRRDGARKAVNAAAAELELDPLAPPLPRFAAGEDVLAAAVRVFKLADVDKRLEKHRACREAAEAEAARLEELEVRRVELDRIELGRKNDQIMAGRAPGPTPAEAIAERRAITDELAFGSPNVRGWIRPDSAVIRETIETSAVLPSAVFYADLVAERLKVLTEDERYNSPASRTAKFAAGQARALAKSLQHGNNRELDRTVRAVRLAVELADLFRLRERQESTVESLEAAKVGR
jgi:hypothetical protein